MSGIQEPFNTDKEYDEEMSGQKVIGYIYWERSGHTPIFETDPEAQRFLELPAAPEDPSPAHQEWLWRNVDEGSDWDTERITWDPA